MNKKKTFTVNDILFNQITRKKGTLEYYLTDELDNERKVTAIAQLGFNRKIKQVKALYKREIPLVEALQKYEAGHTFSIDFTQYNQTPRQAPVKVSGLNSLPYETSFVSQLPDISRFPLLLTISILGSMVVFMFVLFSA